MKRPALLSAALCLIAGLLIGAILPMPWDAPAAAPAAGDAVVQSPLPPPANAPSGSAALSTPEPLNTNDNVVLLRAAYAVVQALKDQDYAAMAAYVHPDKGVAFTPYSTVDHETDHTATRDEIKNLASNETVYTWGLVDGRGSLIELTMAQYFEEYVFNADYTQASQIGIDQIMMGGNALENLPEAYPGCRFVDFYIPGIDETIQGLDWCSLKLVFEPSDTGWLLVGVVHGQWTI